MVAARRLLRHNRILFLHREDPGLRIKLSYSMVRGTVRSDYRDRKSWTLEVLPTVGVNTKPSKRVPRLGQRGIIISHWPAGHVLLAVDHGSRAR